MYVSFPSHCGACACAVRRCECGTVQRRMCSYDALRDTQWVTSYVTTTWYVAAHLLFPLITCVSSLCVQRGACISILRYQWPYHGRAARAPRTPRASLLFLRPAVRCAPPAPCGACMRWVCRKGRWQHAKRPNSTASSQSDSRGGPSQFVHPGQRHRQCDIGIVIRVHLVHHRNVFVPQHLR